MKRTKRAAEKKKKKPTVYECAGADFARSGACKMWRAYRPCCLPEDTCGIRARDTSRFFSSVIFSSFFAFASRDAPFSRSVCARLICERSVVPGSLQRIRTAGDVARIGVLTLLVFSRY